MAQTPPHERWPRTTTCAVGHRPIGVPALDQAAIEPGKAVRLGLPPDAPLGLMPTERAEPFLRHLLRPCPKTVADVITRDDQVAAIAPSPADQHMGVGLVGIEVCGGDPSQVGLTEIIPHPLHHLPHIGREILDTVAMLGRDDQPEVMPIRRPCPHDVSGVEPVRLAIKEVRSPSVQTCACASKIARMLEQGGAPQTAGPNVARDQRLHDDPLADIQSEGTA